MRDSPRRSSTRTTVSQEDYLKAIRKMQEAELEPISARLSEELGVTPPAAGALGRSQAGQ